MDQLQTLTLHSHPGPEIGFSLDPILLTHFDLQHMVIHAEAHSGALEAHPEARREPRDSDEQLI